MIVLLFQIFALSPQKIFMTDQKKTKHYIEDGIFVGGDRKIDQVALHDIRFAMSDQYERLVLDFDANHHGDKSWIKKSPYFQVSVEPDKNQMTVTLFGNPSLSLNFSQILTRFQKSKYIESVQFFPVLDDDRWTFVIALKQPAVTEVFELVSPARVVIDLAEK